MIEEYIPKAGSRHALTEHPNIIVLSAKNKQRLMDRAAQLLGAIRDKKYTDQDLHRIAYTLQVGREEMDERMACIAGTMQELEEKLQAYVDSEEGTEGLFRGQANRNKEALPFFLLMRTWQWLLRLGSEKGNTPSLRIYGSKVSRSIGLNCMAGRPNRV